MKLFDINKGKVIMNPSSIWLPEFKALWDRDRSRTKEKASKEISYVVFMYSHDSPYMAYSITEREEKIIKDYFSDRKYKWTPDDKVKAAVKKFKELQETPTTRLLTSAKMAIEKLEEYFREADSSDASDIIKNAKELGNLVKSIDVLEKQVKKEQLENTNIRGQAEIGLFEL